MEVSGNLRSVLGGWGASGLVLMPADGTFRGPIAVRLDAPGVASTRDQDQMGLRGCPSTQIELKFVRASSGAGNAGNEEPMDILRAGTAAIARGISRQAFERALQYAETRRQGGMAIIDHDAVSDMLGTMASKLACPLPPFGGTERSIGVKVVATNDAISITEDAVQVFGGTGYMCETGVEKLMRDAKYCQMFPESSWTAKEMLLSLVRTSRDGNSAY